MNQGELEVVKQEMARVNIDIPGISELKWTGMGEFNSDDDYIYYSGQESLRRNGVAIMVNKESEMQFLDAVSKMTDLCLFPRKAIQYHIIQGYAPSTNAKEGEIEWFYYYLQDLLELTPQKCVLLIVRIGMQT